MQLKRKHAEIAVFTGLFIWGTISLFRGAGLSFFVSGAHLSRDELFIESLYCSVIAVSFVALFRARIADFVSIAISLIMLIFLFATNGLGMVRLRSNL